MPARSPGDGGVLRTESYCPDCQKSAERAGDQAPPDWYRCPSCKLAIPRHKLPRRTVHALLSPIGQGALNPADFFFIDEEMAHA